MDSTIREWLRSDAKNDRIALAVAPSIGNVTNTNTIQVDFVRFCNPSFAPPQPPIANDFTKQDPNFPSPCDQLLEGLRVQVLERAYIILLHMGDSRSWLRPNAKEAIAARTDEKGNPIAITEAEFDSDVPSKRHAIPLAPLGRYAYFWTYDKDIFKDVWSKLQTNFRSTLEHHPFYTFSLGTSAKHNIEAESLIPPNSRRPELRNLASFLLFRVNDGTTTGTVLRELTARGHIEDLSRYVVARSDALATFYLTELANRLGFAINSRTAEDWNTILRARDIASYAAEKRRHPDFDAALPHIDAQSQPKHWFFTGFNDEYHEYAYNAARAPSTRVKRDLFQASIDMRVANEAWMEAAGKILEETERTKNPARHPSLELDESQHLRWKPPPDHGLGALRYFDFYRFGFDTLQLFSERRLLPLAERSIADLRTDISNLLRNTLKAHSPYQRFMQELGAHAHGNSRERIATHTAYLRTAMTVGYKWWNDFDTAPPSGRQSADRSPFDPLFRWDDLERYTSWISTLAGKLGDLMSCVFGSPNAAFETNHLVSESAEGFEALFRKLKDYDKRLGSGKMTRILPTGMRIEIDFEQGRYFVIEEGRHPIGPVYFLVETEANWNTAGNLSVQPGKVSVRKANLHGMRVVEMEGRDAPFREVHEVPVWLQAFSSLVGLAITLSNISKDFKEQGGISVFMKVAAGTLQSIASIGDTIRLISYTNNTLPFTQSASRALRTAEILGPLGGAVEAFASAREGYLLFFGHDKGKPNELDETIEAGDTLVASALRLKGTVLLSNLVPGVAGTASFAGNAAVATNLVQGEEAASLAAGAESLAGLATVWLAITGLLVLGIDIYIYSIRGPQDAMDELRKALAGAIKREFGNIDKSEHHLSRTADDLGDFDRALQRAIESAHLDTH
jgi:hypothetical protein